VAFAGEKDLSANLFSDLTASKKSKINLLGVLAVKGLSNFD
jgi:hypothetical protein